MENILNLGIAMVLFLQSLGSWLIGPMKFFSFLGNEEFYLLVAPVLYWCVDAGLGLRTGLALMISNAANFTLKLAFNAPRPYWYHPKVQPMSAETSFGIPSGHSQNAVVVWGTIAAWIGKTWAWIVAGMLMFMIGISRMYLGVHFPADVLVGWAVGALLLWAILRFEKRFLDWFRCLSRDNQILTALGASLTMILVGALVRLTLGDWEIPEAWITLAARAPEAEPIDPLALSGLISYCGTFFGMATGSILLWQRGWYEARGAYWQQVARYLIGLAGVMAIWYGLGAVFPRGEDLLPYLLRYIRYGLVGLWITGLAPMLFIWLKLARPTH